MTFTSVASNNTHDNVAEQTALNIVKLSKISIAASLSIVGLTLLQNLLWTSASYPAEIPHPHAATATK
ncbi:hypothetical protein [Chamaesiphon sp. VAR_48_metabat_403]|uniref:hypothetical protein n=1 Tax=Chamaesiphon sp. VAR_48_metabat_403 TaxID=2964700 RepID=UPI00286DDB85|nr:hypothetical protein [Chamaesiphon sp. VAR_48_metabat_403]